MFWREAAPSVSPQQPAGPAALRAQGGDIPGMFTHHWRSWSVCLSLWPQHKQLGPQINKARGRGRECKQDAVQRDTDNESGPPLFVWVRVCVYMCVYTLVRMQMFAMCGSQCLLVEDSTLTDFKVNGKAFCAFIFFFFLERDAPKLFSHSSLFPSMITQNQPSPPESLLSLCTFERPPQFKELEERGQRKGGRGRDERQRKRQREENTKLADTGHNLISTVGGQLCSVICHGSPFRLQWQAWPAKENSNCSQSPLSDGGGDRATIYGLVLKKHTLLSCYW